MSEQVMKTAATKSTWLLALALSAGCTFPIDHTTEPGFSVGDGGVCSMGDAATAGTIIVCGGRCVDTQSNAAHCGGCGITCASNQLCALGRCSAVCSQTAPCAAGELCVRGICVYAPPPATVLATLVDEGEIRVRHSLEQLRLSAPVPVTFYYTLDGSLPEMGGPNTRTAMGQSVVLPTIDGLDDMPMGACRTVRWLADYGPPLGREVIVHGASFCNNAPQSDVERNYETIDRFSLSVAGVDQGAVAVVMPGAGVRVGFRLRTMNSGAPMMPARISRAARVYLEQESMTVPPPFCHEYGDGAPRPTGPTTATGDFMVTAPSAPGRYALRLSIATDPSSDVCRTLNGLGAVRTLGVIVVR
jgi:hypothetical protein